LTGIDERECEKMSSDDRTDEQRTADDNLTDAISKSLKAYGFEENYILTDYVVVAAQVKMDDSGNTISAYSQLYRDSDVPYYKILGLLEVARCRAKFDMMHGEDD
jgi:hypothetical protein